MLKTTTKGGQIMLDIDGQQYDVLVRDIQYNAIKVKDLDIAKDTDIELKTDPEAVVVTVTQVHNNLPADDTGEEAAAE